MTKIPDEKKNKEFLKREVEPEVKPLFEKFLQNGTQAILLIHPKDDKMIYSMHVIDVANMQPTMAMVYLMLKQVKSKMEIEAYRDLLKAMVDQEMMAIHAEGQANAKFKQIVMPDGRPANGGNNRSEVR